jgi:hypothetical protein
MRGLDVRESKKRKKGLITMSASVKVMRSYDYCHFEVCLGTDEDVTLQDVDNMRKEAMRLVDKAVEQYKKAKEVMNFREAHDGLHYRRLKKEVEEIEKIPESERAPEHKTALKEWKDINYKMQRRYDYEDDWEW